MTEPDDGLEDTLREALSAAASQVEPGDGGLERILVRTGDAVPRSWLSAVAMEAVRRVRHWVWRGHWAWQDPGPWRARYSALQGRVVLWWRRGRGTHLFTWLAGLPAGAATLAASVPIHDALAFRSHRLTWMRLVVGFAAAASIAAITVADPPLRAALVQVSATALAGGNEVLQPGIDVPGGRTAAAAGTHGPSPSGSAGALAGTLPHSGRPGTTSSPTPCLTAPAPTAPSGSAATLSATPSATPASIAPASVPAALLSSATATPGTVCATASVGAAPSPTPLPSASTSPSPTQAPPTTAPPTTAPPTTAPPTTPPPTTTPPTGTATPTPTSSSSPSISSTATGGTSAGNSPGGITPSGLRGKAAGHAKHARRALL